MEAKKITETGNNQIQQNVIRNQTKYCIIKVK